MNRRLALIAVIPLALGVIEASPAAADLPDGQQPVITSITVSPATVVISNTKPCTQVTVSIAFDPRQGTVQEIQVPVESAPHANAPQYKTALIPAQGATSVTGGVNYCATEEGVGVLYIGDCEVDYTSTEGPGYPRDPAYTSFDAQQASTGSLTGHRIKKRRHHPSAVALLADQRYANYQDGSIYPVTGEAATLQRLHGATWVTVSTKHGTTPDGHVTFKVAAPHRHSYRVMFAGSTTVAPVTSRTVTV